MNLTFLSSMLPSTWSSFMPSFELGSSGEIRSMVAKIGFAAASPDWKKFILGAIPIHRQ